MQIFFPNSVSVLESAICKIETWHLSCVLMLEHYQIFALKQYNCGNSMANSTLTLKTSCPLSINYKYQTRLNLSPNFGGLVPDP